MRCLLSKLACAFALEISDLAHSNDYSSAILEEYVMDFLLYLESWDLRFMEFGGIMSKAYHEVLMTVL
jgi:hypothetical protein